MANVFFSLITFVTKIPASATRDLPGSKQILKCGLYLYENEKEYLENKIQASCWIENQGYLPSFGEEFYKRPSCFDSLTLFKAN